jgi:lipopolysaccharide transport system ATP-binding protein
VVNRYHDVLFGQDQKTVVLPAASSADASNRQTAVHALSLDRDDFATHLGYNPHEYRWGDKAAEILDFYTECNGIGYPVSIKSGQTLALQISVRFLRQIVNPIFGLTLKTKEGVTLYGSNSELLGATSVRALGAMGTSAIISTTLQANLAPGDYFISLGIATRHGETITPHDRRYDAIHLTIESPEPFFGLAQMNLCIEQAVHPDQ